MPTLSMKNDFTGLVYKVVTKEDLQMYWDGIVSVCRLCGWLIKVDQLTYSVQTFFYRKENDLEAVYNVEFKKDADGYIEQINIKRRHEQIPYNADWNDDLETTLDQFRMML